MARCAPRLGRHVTLARFDGGMHDLTLSGPAVREQVFAELGRWAEAFLAAGPTAPAARRSAVAHRASRPPQADRTPTAAGRAPGFQRRPGARRRLARRPGRRRRAQSRRASPEGPLGCGRRSPPGARRRRAAPGPGSTATTPRWRQLDDEDRRAHVPLRQFRGDPHGVPVADHPLDRDLQRARPVFAYPMGQHESGTGVGAEAGDHLGPGGDPRGDRLDPPPPAAVPGQPVQARVGSTATPSPGKRDQPGTMSTSETAARATPAGSVTLVRKPSSPPGVPTRSAAVSSDSPPGRRRPGRRTRCRIVADRYGRMARPTT